MADAWDTFPAQMAEPPAWVSYNKSYAEIAKQDPRATLLKARLKFKRPTPQGMPTREEFPDVSRVEDLLDEAITAAGGVEVGRRTLSGFRDYYFYVGFPQEKAKTIAETVTAKTAYPLELSLQPDPEKRGYWKDLYPTADDEQVIGDLSVLESLRERGDVNSIRRVVAHWAYFPAKPQAQQFADWANTNFYKINSVEATEDKKMVVVRFSHEGTMVLEDITRHTIAINRKAVQLGGNYDGWETSIETRK